MLHIKLIMYHKEAAKQRKLELKMVNNIQKTEDQKNEIELRKIELEIEKLKLQRKQLGRKK